MMALAIIALMLIGCGVVVLAFARAFGPAKGGSPIPAGCAVIRGWWCGSKVRANGQLGTPSIDVAYTVDHLGEIQLHRVALSSPVEGGNFALESGECVAVTATIPRETLHGIARAECDEGNPLRGVMLHEWSQSGRGGKRHG